MDLSFLNPLMEQLKTLVGAANDLPGTVAFAAGAFSWFMVEQIIRRLASIMRMLLLVGLITAAGVSAFALVNYFFNDGDTSGFDLNNDQVSLEVM